MINKISYYIVTFSTIAISPNKVRGYVGRVFEDNKAYHNHTDLGFDYIYPRVQYRLIDESN